MRYHSLFAAVSLTLGAGAKLHAQRPALSPAVRAYVSVDSPTVALTHARVIDGTGAAARDNQTIVIRDDLFAGYRSRSDFIRHYVFPGGMLPSFARFREEAERAGLKVLDNFAFGQDYARTLREWSARMSSREAEIRALGYDTKFLRNWQFYLGICAAAFAVDRTDVIQVELAHA